MPKIAPKKITYARAEISTLFFSGQKMAGKKKKGKKALLIQY